MNKNYDDVYGWILVLYGVIVVTLMVIGFSVSLFNNRIDKHRDWLCANTTMVNDCIDGGSQSLAERVKELERQLEEERK